MWYYKNIIYTPSVSFYSAYSFLARKLAQEYFLHKTPSWTIWDQRKIWEIHILLTYHNKFGTWTIWELNGEGVIEKKLSYNLIFWNKCQKSIGTIERNGGSML
jgi:hypothetical protein